MQELMFQAEVNNNLPRGMLSAIAKVESGHNPKAYTKYDGWSGKASHGLFQLQLAAARQVGFKGNARDLMNVQVNIKYAALYFKWLVDKHNKDYARALTCLNSGPYSELCKSGKYSNYSGKVFNEMIKNK